MKIIRDSRFVPAAPIVIAAAYVLQIGLVGLISYHGHVAADAKLNYIPGARPIQEWIDQVPIRPIAPEFVSARWIFPLFFLLGLIQAAALFYLYRAIGRNGIGPAARTAIAIGAAVMAAISLLAPVSTSADAYAYIGYGLAPTLHASFATNLYAPPPAFSVISAMYGQPAVPNPYGAGFYGLMSLVRIPGLPLVADLYALRIIGAAAFAGIVVLSRKLVPPAAVWTLALCPALYLDWILNSHNDVLPILFIFVALASISKRVVLSIAAVVAVALFKLPLLTVAITSVAKRSPLRDRIVLVTAMIAVSAVFVVALDGKALIAGNVYRVSGNETSVDHVVSNSGAVATKAAPKRHSFKLRAVVFLLVLAVMAIALIRKRATAGNAFIFAALAPASFSWYETWGMGYAALAPATFGYFVIILPIVTSYLDLQPTSKIPPSVLEPLFAIAVAAFFAYRRTYERTDVSLQTPP